MKNSLCKYCLGCNKLENPKFIEVMNCKNFVPAYKNWQEQFYQKMKEERR